MQDRYSKVSKYYVREQERGMFGYRSNVPKVRLTTDRLVVRLVHDRESRLADYYAENKGFLKPWSRCAMTATVILPAGRRVYR